MIGGGSIVGFVQDPSASTKSVVAFMVLRFVSGSDNEMTGTALTERRRRPDTTLRLVVVVRSVDSAVELRERLVRPKQLPG
jgi:hypothetical protein